MTVIVESKKIKVTKAIRNFAQKQAQKLNRLGKGVIDIKIHLEKITQKKMDSSTNIVTYFVSIPGKNIVVKRRSSDMYQAITQATSSAVRKLRKVSEKRQTIKRGHKIKQQYSGIV